MAKRMIINADDFGGSQSVNEAIRTAHERGIVTSATMMANMPAAEAAVSIAKRLPKLGVGVHLNLFTGEPLSKDERVTRLVDKDGRFCCSPWQLSLLSVFSHRVRAAMTIEMEAQIEWLIKAGIEPMNLDSHKHIHFFPPVYRMVCRLAQKYGIRAVRWCYEPSELGYSPWPLSNKEGRRSAANLRVMAKTNRLGGGKFAKTQRLYGVTHLGHVDSNYFKSICVYNTCEVAEIMTHPAMENDAGSKDIPWKPKGKTELDALCEEKTRRYFDEAQVELINYGNI